MPSRNAWTSRKAKSLAATVSDGMPKGDALTLLCLNVPCAEFSPETKPARVSL
jgi:hypothetical protein